MNVEMLEADRDVAMSKWREYRTALKIEKTREIARLATIYWQLSRGRKVINAVEAIQNAGLSPLGHPTLAIAEAHRPDVTLHYSSDVCFYHEAQQWPVARFNRPASWPNAWHRLTAPVPLVPPSQKPPDMKLENLHILWEVPKWEKVAPSDPLLLKRLDGQFYVVLAAWDLTDVERAVMNAGFECSDEQTAGG